MTCRGWCAADGALRMVRCGQPRTRSCGWQPLRAVAACTVRVPARLPGVGLSPTGRVPTGRVPPHPVASLRSRARSSPTPATRAKSPCTTPAAARQPGSARARACSGPSGARAGPHPDPGEPARTPGPRAPTGTPGASAGRWRQIARAARPRTRRRSRAGAVVCRSAMAGQRGRAGRPRASAPLPFSTRDAPGCTVLEQPRSRSCAAVRRLLRSESRNCAAERRPEPRGAAPRALGGCVHAAFSR